MLKLYLNRTPQDVKLTSAYADIQYGRAKPRNRAAATSLRSKKQPSNYTYGQHVRPNEIKVTPSACVPNLRKVVTSTAGPPGPH